MRVPISWLKDYVDITIPIPGELSNHLGGQVVGGRPETPGCDDHVDADLAHVVEGVTEVFTVVVESHFRPVRDAVQRFIILAVMTEIVGELAANYELFEIRFDTRMTRPP